MQMMQNLAKFFLDETQLSLKFHCSTITIAEIYGMCFKDFWNTPNQLPSQVLFFLKITYNS